MNAQRALLPLALAILATPAAAQNGDKLASRDTTRTPGAAPAQPAPPSATLAMVSVGSPAAGGIGQFEAPKQNLEFDGLRMQIGGAFSQTFQALDHSTQATPAAKTTLGEIRPGFNLAAANFNLGVQLARGIRVDLENYMASRHHNEFWVKGGFATIDASPLDVPVLHRIMEHTTIRAGMYEVNYGDAHFRRTDNGNAIRNPFIENYILDSFTTEVGADVLVRGPAGTFVLGGITSGQNKGDVKDGAVDASPAYLGKVGIDRRFGEGLRLRLTGSTYRVGSTPSATLFAGDRTGSHYGGVMEDTATLRAGTAFTNGRINPGFTNELTAYQVNPYVEIGGLEVFGMIERASGKAAAEESRREVNQVAGDVVYRFLNDQLYVGGRWNRLTGDFSGQKDLKVTRSALAAGWFLTRNLLTKVEYVRQDYAGFAATDIRHGAKFDGVSIEGVIAF